MAMDWRFEIQWRGPLIHRMYPRNDCDLKRSGCLGGLGGLGSDASWGTQLELVSAHSLFGGRGESRKADTSFDCCVVNAILSYL